MKGANGTLDRLLDRLGAGYVAIPIAIAGMIATGFTALNVTILALLYFSATTGEYLRLLVLAELIDVATLVVGVLVMGAPVRALIAWVRADYPSESAGDAWTNAMQLPRKMVPPIAALLVITEIPALAYARSIFGESFGLIPLALVALIETVAAGALLAYLAVEVFVRPVAQRALRALPADFVPASVSLSLRAKLLIGLPVVNVMTAFVAVGLARESLSPSGQLAVAVGAALLVSLSVSLALTWIISRSVSGPVEELVEATESVAADNLDVRLHPQVADELGRLAGRFNHMVAGLREREALRGENAKLIDDLRASRARIVAASAEARRRVERDLHDGAQQYLVVANLKAGLVARAVDADPKTSKLAAELRGDLDRALAELRDLAHGIYPAILTSDGLPGALAEAAHGAAIPTAVDCDGAGRYPPDLEAAVYFCCLEALQNAAKHAGGDASARINVAQSNGELRFEVADDGAGFDAEAADQSSGLQGMADRIGALGGSLMVDSAPGQGTRVAGRVPVATKPTT